MEADPEFYQLWSVLRDARRLLRKDGRLLELWSCFMSNYDGTSFHGPFSKLLQVCTQIGWRVADPPVLLDHGGFRRDLLRTPAALLRRLAEQAWLNHVARQHQHRATMVGLNSLDRTLATLDFGRLSALDLGRVAAIQSGAFLFGQHHAKFDMSKSGLCSVCHVPDTVEHRICHCSQYAAARSEHAWVVDLWPALPLCMSHHLLPPRNPFLSDVAAHLHALPDSTASFHSLHVTSGRQNLFSDGSCLWPDIPELALASWGLVSASSGKVLGCGHVCGELQTTPRAELTAAIAAVKWANCTRRQVTLWCDAKHVVDGLHYLLMGGDSPGTQDNHDLWEELQALLTELQPDFFWVKHVPSHLDARRCDSPLEEWIAQHNQHADRVAGLANCNRPQSFVTVHAQALEHHFSTAKVLRALRALFCAVADTSLGARAAEPEDVERILGVGAPVHCEESLADQLPVGWRQQLSVQSMRVPQAFVESVWEFILRHDVSSELKRQVSLLELIFMNIHAGEISFPAVCPHTGGWVLAHQVPFRPEKLTLAVQLKLFRDAVTSVLRMCGLSHLLVRGVSLVECGVTRPCDCLSIGVDVTELFEARLSLSSFAARRPIRTSADLARPV